MTTSDCLTNDKEHPVISNTTCMPLFHKMDTFQELDVEWIKKIKGTTREIWEKSGIGKTWAIQPNRQKYRRRYGENC